MQEQRLCARAGCTNAGTVVVELAAADGDDEWFACQDDALAFEAWVLEETRKQAAWTRSVFESADGSYMRIAVVDAS